MVAPLLQQAENRHKKVLDADLLACSVHVTTIDDNDNEETKKTMIKMVILTNEHLKRSADLERASSRATPKHESARRQRQG